MIKLFTIGFTGKSAETFFQLLQHASVKKIVDTRINNLSQLSGFAKGPDLKFFLSKVTNISYEHNIDFAPTRELLLRYRDNQITWKEYASEYLHLLDTRKVTQKTHIEDLHENCFLCSEHTPEKCHRRLLAEYFKAVHNDMEIIHLL